MFCCLTLSLGKDIYVAYPMYCLYSNPQNCFEHRHARHRAVALASAQQ
jgi:hypothetical protein